jgi:NAD+ kinase
MTKHKKVGLVAKPHATNLSIQLPRIISLLNELDCQVFLDDQAGQLSPDHAKSMSRGELVNASDMVIVLGGDGTMLSLAKYQPENPKPVLGINMGSLGFLTEVAVTEASTMIRAALDDRLELTNRMMLESELIRGGKEQPLQRVLNDVVINKSALARIFNIEIKIDGAVITTIRADGIIVTTPTGSTAYNLAANGPIIYPEMQVIGITPICPHTLTYRPVVLPGEAVLDLTLLDSEETYLTMDGQAGFPLHQGDTVRVYKSRRVMPIYKPGEKSFFEVLKNKLKWGDR